MYRNSLCVLASFSVDLKNLRRYCLGRKELRFDMEWKNKFSYLVMCQWTSVAQGILLSIAT